MTDLAEALTGVLEREFEDFRSFKACERLSGGANQETYRVRYQTPDGERVLCLRRAAGGEEHVVPGQPGLATEARLFRASAAAGVPEPEVYYLLRPQDGAGTGFLMQWLEGETLGARIARGQAFDGIRGRLAYQCGEFLARIHGIDLDATGLRDALEHRSPREIVESGWLRYQEFGTPQPMIDYTARWLLDHLPDSGEPMLVHGDFRNGNLMVDPDDGVVAVLDWEGAHIGDPVRDLGWVCTNSWRFGVHEKVVGGFGDLDDLLAGYASVAGAPVDRDRVRFWITYGSFNWSIGCLAMAEHYRTGPDATVERPAIGRRSSECQVDCANLLLAEEPVAVPEPPATVTDLDMPRSDELLTSVRDFLRSDVMSETQGRTHFLARVAANSLDILLREQSFRDSFRQGEVARLGALLQLDADYFALRSELSERIRRGAADLQDPVLREYLRYATVTQALIDQPRYSGVRAALDGSTGDDPA